MPLQHAPASRLPALDGLRGLAVVLVIAGHASYPQNETLAATGVTVFFVLSGYLITSILLKSPSRGSAGLRAFYGRRARRLLPALVVLLLVEATYRSLIGESLVPVVLAAGYLTNLAAAVGDTSSLQHTWSLALEEQFYLVWPLLLPFLVRLRHGVRIVVGAAAGCAVLRVLLFFGLPDHWELAYFGPVTRADGILVGCALAIAMNRGFRLPDGQLGRGLMLIAVATIPVGLALPSRPSSVLLMPLTALASAVIIASVSGGSSNALARVLELPPLRWAGRVSYGMYLWHPLVLVTVVGAGVSAWFPVTLVISTALASLSWFVVERPWLEGMETRSTRSRGVPRPTEVLSPSP